MEITSQSTVSEVAAHLPATVRVFQQHQIDFCCGGKRPLAEACADRGLDVDALLEQLRAAGPSDAGERNWAEAPLGDVVAYIQARFHEPLREELPRLAAMMARVVERHGAHHPVVRPLQQTFDRLRHELLDHMRNEDAVLFPAIVALETGGGSPAASAWIDQPIGVLEGEHESAARALARMRELTTGYMPPAGACPTFRGLYYGLAELEREMHVHVHLENNVLFPRASTLAHG